MWDVKESEILILFFVVLRFLILGVNFEEKYRPTIKHFGPNILCFSKKYSIEPLPDFDFTN